MTDWEVARTTGTCCISGRAFEEGEAYHTALFAAGDSFERKDYAEECWSGPPEGAYCTWKARLPVKDRPRKLLVDDQVLVTFFERLERETDEPKLQFRFVLALILMRKRLLKYVESQIEGGVEWWTLRAPGSQTTHRVRNPGLDEQRIKDVAGQLGAILTTDYSAFDEAETSDEEDQADAGEPRNDSADGVEPTGASDQAEVHDA
jgi:hypothetical protein